MRWHGTRFERPQRSSSKYVAQGWLEGVVRGIYQRPTGNIDQAIAWQRVIISLQRLLRKSEHVGGRSALELQGLTHYLRFSGKPEIHLYAYGSLPGWVERISDVTPAEAQCLRRGNEPCSTHPQSATLVLEMIFAKGRINIVWHPTTPSPKGAVPGVWAGSKKPRCRNRYQTVKLDSRFTERVYYRVNSVISWHGTTAPCPRSSDPPTGCPIGCLQFVHQQQEQNPCGNETLQREVCVSPALINEALGQCLHAAVYRFACFLKFAIMPADISCGQQCDPYPPPLV